MGCNAHQQAEKLKEFLAHLLSNQVSCSRGQGVTSKTGLHVARIHLGMIFDGRWGKEEFWPHFVLSHNYCLFVLQSCHTRSIRFSKYSGFFLKEHIQNICGLVCYRWRSGDKGKVRKGCTTRDELGWSSPCLPEFIVPFTLPLALTAFIFSELLPLRWAHGSFSANFSEHREHFTFCVIHNISRGM